MNTMFTTEAQAACRAFESRWRTQRRRAGRGRWLNRRQVREALQDVEQVVALVGLYLPVREARMVEPILQAIEAAGGAAAGGAR